METPECPNCETSKYVREQKKRYAGYPTWFCKQCSLIFPCQPFTRVEDLREEATK